MSEATDTMPPATKRPILKLKFPPKDVPTTLTHRPAEPAVIMNHAAPSHAAMSEPFRPPAAKPHNGKSKFAGKPGFKGKPKFPPKSTKRKADMTREERIAWTLARDKKARKKALTKRDGLNKLALRRITKVAAREMFIPRDPRPLSVGFYRLVREKLTDLQAKRISTALAWWTQRPEYLQAIAKGGPRFNLKGKQAGWITDSHQRSARIKLGLEPADATAAQGDA